RLRGGRGPAGARGPPLPRQYRTLTDDPKLHAFLQLNRGQARFLLATSNALLAAPVIIHTGQPVMAFGGFFGNDPVISVEGFANAVERAKGAFLPLPPTGGRPTSSAWCTPLASPSTPP